MHATFGIVSLVIIAGSLGLGLRYFYLSPIVAAIFNLFVSRHYTASEFDKRAWFLAAAYPIAIFLLFATTSYLILSRI